MITLTWAEALSALQDALRAGVTPVLEGPPGVGKTALANAALAAYGADIPEWRGTQELIASNCDATDFDGFPFVTKGRLERARLPQIAACIASPAGLLIDEYKSAPLNVRASLMNILLFRRIQGVSFDTQSRVIAATNPPEQCPAGTEGTAAEGNRVICYHYQPSFDEIRSYFAGLGVEGSTLRNEACDFAATLAVETRLVTFDPPRAAIDAGAPFSSPRAWELGIRTLAAHLDNGGSVESTIALAHLAGITGEDSALAYLGIRRLRKDLPSVDEIRANPGNARVPECREHQIAALGLLARVADADVWAAWIYLARLHDEIGAACARTILERPARGHSPHATAGIQIRTTYLAKLRRLMGD